MNHYPVIFWRHLPKFDNLTRDLFRRAHFYYQRATRCAMETFWERDREWTHKVQTLRLPLALELIIAPGAIMYGYPYGFCTLPLLFSFPPFSSYR